MPVPPAIIRQAATLVALIGCALALGPARGARAAGCHVDDRPAFGLSVDAGNPADPTGSGPAIASDGPVRIDRRCPIEVPGRPTPRIVSPGDATPAAETAPILPPSWGYSRAECRGSCPLIGPHRIDRPPRPR